MAVGKPVRFHSGKRTPTPAVSALVCVDVCSLDLQAHLAQNQSSFVSNLAQDKSLLESFAAHLDSLFLQESPSQRYRSAVGARSIEDVHAGFAKSSDVVRDHQNAEDIKSATAMAMDLCQRSEFNIEPGFGMVVLPVRQALVTLSQRHAKVLTLRAPL